MIGSMDQVYSKAFLTIVAAAGHDAYHGLPGVGKTCRKRQAALKFGKVNLLEHLSPHPGTLLKTSAWGTRGWTCQEGLLSRRRLVFTDQQTSFVCREMFILESVKRPKQYIWSLDHEPFEIVETLVPSYRQRLNNQTKETIMYLKSHIEAYTGRRLRFEEDSLKAFMGVLAFYAKKGVYHNWGLPICRWGYLGARISIQMDWYHIKLATRRPHCPSWSW